MQLKGEIERKKPLYREKCLHVALLNNKNRHQIANERIDAVHGGVLGFINQCIYFPCSAPVLIS